MIKTIKCSLLVTIVMSTTACGWLFDDEGMFRDRGNDYRKARTTAPLLLPEGVRSETIDDTYHIPAITDDSKLAGEFVIPRPEELDEQTERETVRINRLANEQWILVDGSPGHIWSRLRGFFNLAGIPLTRVDALKGVLETTWIQPVESNLSKERYRIYVTQGVQRDSAEVSMLQMDESAGANWPQHSSNPQREDLFIQQLSQYLADTAINSSVSMLAEQNMDSSGLITLEQAKDKPPYLRLQLPFYRAWASLGLAIPKAGYIQDDIDVSQKLYYVRYIEPESEKEGGWFSGWFSANTNEFAGIAYLIRVIEVSPQHVHIFIERQNGAAMAEGEAGRLLKLIKKRLS